MLLSPTFKCGHLRGNLRAVSNRGKDTGAIATLRSEKQYVPFGGRSPEAVAAGALNRLLGAAWSHVHATGHLPHSYVARCVRTSSFSSPSPFPNMFLKALNGIIVTQVFLLAFT
eukprot:1161392-Pelagomonas_calceolata.AAC.16